MSVCLCSYCLQWLIDSGAVSDWNVGRCPDPRALNCLRNHEIETAHKARQVERNVSVCVCVYLGACVFRKHGHTCMAQLFCVLCKGG